MGLGDTCFSATQGSLGDCASPNICLDNVCTAPDSTCIQPVNGLCFQRDTSSSLGSCCSGSICTPLISDPTSDYFCQKILEVGEDCNPDEKQLLPLLQPPPPPLHLPLQLSQLHALRRIQLVSVLPMELLVIAALASVMFMKP